MKKKIDFRIIIGIAGILFVILFFIVSSITEDISGSKEVPKNKYKLLSLLLQELNYNAHYYYKSIIPKDNAVIIFFDYTESDDKIMEELIDWTANGGILFIIGVDAERDPFSEYSLKRSNDENIHIADTYSDGVENISLFNPKYFVAPFIKNSILSTDKNSTLFYYKKNMLGKVYVLADGRLFDNPHLSRESHAVLLNNILKKYYDKKIYIFRNKFVFAKKMPTILILFKGKLAFITIQLILIVLLFYLWQGNRFGRPIRLNPYKNMSVLEHLDAVGMFYHKTQSLNIIDKINNDYFLFSLKKVLNISGDVSIKEIKKIFRNKKSETFGDVDTLIEGKEVHNQNDLIMKERQREEILNEFSDILKKNKE